MGWKEEGEWRTAEEITTVLTAFLYICMPFFPIINIQIGKSVDYLKKKNKSWGRQIGITCKRLLNKFSFVLEEKENSDDILLK